MTSGQTIEALKKGPFKPFDFNGYHPVTLQIKNGVLLYEFKIWGGVGQPPIEIKDNQFTVRVPGSDRNFNDKAFEVVDSQSNPIFQMVRKTPTDFFINGVFPMPNGGLIVAGPDGANLNVASVPPGFKLQPIFKYPSWKFPGEYAN